MAVLMLELLPETILAGRSALRLVLPLLLGMVNDGE
jgi:hypothetical protein